MENKISLIVPVYNEEKRISRFLDGISWCDDVIIINKSSTDKTLAYCKRKNVVVYDVPYTDSDGMLFEKFIKYAKHDWVGIFVVSDFIDYSLVIKANELILNKEVTANTIYTHYKNYILGISEKYSPWYNKKRRFIFKKNTVKFSDIVHCELQCDEKNAYYIPEEYGNIYHLTHQSVESQFERHIRYTKREAENLYNNKVSLNKLKYGILKKIVKYMLKNIFIEKSINAFALSIAYLMYYMDIFLFTWEKTQNIEETYEKIKTEVINELEKKLLI